MRTLMLCGVATRFADLWLYRVLLLRTLRYRFIPLYLMGLSLQDFSLVLYT